MTSCPDFYNFVEHYKRQMTNYELLNDIYHAINELKKTVENDCTSLILLNSRIADAAVAMLNAKPKIICNPAIDAYEEIMVKAAKQLLMFKLKLEEPDQDLIRERERLHPMVKKKPVRSLQTGQYYHGEAEQEIRNRYKGLTFVDSDPKSTEKGNSASFSKLVLDRLDNHVTQTPMIGTNTGHLSPVSNPSQPCVLQNNPVDAPFSARD